MSLGIAFAGSAERTDGYAGDRPVPQIPYLDYYDAAHAIQEEQHRSAAMYTEGEEFTAPTRMAEDLQGRQEQLSQHHRIDSRQPDAQAVTPQHSMTYREMLASKINEILEKIEAGATKPSFPIGAAYFTLKEWELFIKTFDKIQEEIKKEAGQELPPEDTTVAAREKRLEEEEVRTPEQLSLLLLTAETTVCTYPAPDEEEETEYRTYYTEDEIYCKKTDESGYEWEIQLESRDQYEQIMDLLGRFDGEDNLRFACHENFWRDYLDGALDLDGFLEFMDTRVVDGIPNYVNSNEYGMWIDTEAAKYAKYMNKSGLFRAVEIV